MTLEDAVCLLLLTSYARLSASLATVRPASSPRPSSLSMASSVPMMNDFPEVGGKVIASTRKKKRKKKRTDKNGLKQSARDDEKNDEAEDVLAQAPSSVRFPSCSLNRTALGRDWGVDGGCVWDRSSASLRLASMSCSFDRFGPVQHVSSKVLTNKNTVRDTKTNKHELKRTKPKGGTWKKSSTVREANKSINDSVQKKLKEVSTRVFVRWTEKEEKMLRRIHL